MGSRSEPRSGSVVTMYIKTLFIAISHETVIVPLLGVWKLLQYYKWHNSSHYLDISTTPSFSLFYNRSQVSGVKESIMLINARNYPI